MAHERDRKQLLIVDDTEIDRIILKSIVAKDFDIIEANNGNIAFEYITKMGDQLDAILLDITMPHINGFDVLRFMKDKEITEIPVFLVTAETTRENVEKAMQYNISDFIGKPFERDDVLRRLRSKLGLSPNFDLSKEDMKVTMAYISDLEAYYKRYLANFGKDDTHYRVMVDLMRILLNQYNRNQRDAKLNADSIELISKAAYFCDIGEMLIPDKRLQAMFDREQTQAIQENHTVYGSNFIRLNRAKSCEYFVEICASMCLHHHERFDGTGYPNHLNGKNNSIYNQMCRLVDEFEQMRSKFYGDKSRPVKFVVKRLVNNNVGMVGPKIYSTLENCEPLLVDYFIKKDT